MSEWHFRAQQPGDTSREPIQGEFFADEAIEDVSAAVVREAIQNSLDARAGTDPVRIRIYASGSAGALGARTARPFFDTLWPHLAARRNGLRNAPGPGDSCPYLVFEDFATHGLTGDPAQWHHKEGVQNGFFTFFRAEGVSDKSAGDRGRWGVGKFVFPRSSRISTFFGLTVRGQDRPRMPLLLGRCILRSHSVRHDRFGPDGYFGGREGRGDLVLPTAEDTVIETFRRTWNVRRRNTDPGLTVVVPYCDEEITYQSLVLALCRDFFFAIVRGELTAEVEGPATSTRIDADTLDDVVRTLDDEHRHRIGRLLDLSRWALVTGRQGIVTIEGPTGQGAPKWTPDMIAAPLLASLREEYSRPTGRIAVRVPIRVRPKSGADQSTHFDIFIQRDSESSDARPLFVREGLIIPDVKSRRLSGSRALVLIDDRPLASFLGDSENPSHTRWHKDSSNFKGKYTYGPGLIDFVTESVSQLIGIINASDREVDRDLLADVFSITRAGRGGVVGPARPGPGGGRTGPPVIPQPARPQPFRVSRVVGGFSITAGSPNAPPPADATVKVAYDVRSGNPLAAYDPSDFDLGRAPITVEPARGIGAVRTDRNTIRFEIQQPDFEVTLRGFDPNRDLYVKVQEGNG